MDDKRSKAQTVLSLWKATWPTAMSPCFFGEVHRLSNIRCIIHTFKLPAGVYMTVILSFLFPMKCVNVHHMSDASHAPSIELALTS